MKQYMPMLMIRTAGSHAAIELNGSIIGEAAEEAHLALPLSESGKYYIGIYPLEDDERRYYPVVRKLSFSKGALLAIKSDDVEAYEWPGGVYETIFSPGVFRQREEPVFPFVLDQLVLAGGRIATLYYEDGLKLAIEEGSKVRFGTFLSQHKDGRLLLKPNGVLFAFYGLPELPGGMVPEGYAKGVLVLNNKYDELMRIEGEAVGLLEDGIVRFTRLDTLLEHERREVFYIKEDEVEAKPPLIGFYTHTPKKPEQSGEMIRAFCDAVRYELWDEAFSYLTKSLAEGLTSAEIISCLGEFSGCRAPLSRSESAMGLVYPAQNGISKVRVFTFSFLGGLIDNLAED